MIGIQLGPASLLDEGVEPVLDTLQSRFGIDTLLVSTFSWLGLKVGRRGTAVVEGWPDHGVPAPLPRFGGSYVRERPEYLSGTFIRGFGADHPGLGGRDILDMLIPAAQARGLRVLPEFMEPLFRAPPAIPGLAGVLEIDASGRAGPEPCTSHPAYRGWWHGVIEAHCREYAIQGVMWCNERDSPLDRIVQGRQAGCFCLHCRAEAAARGVDVEQARLACLALAEAVPLGPMAALRALLAHPEALIWERFWLQRNKDLDRELHGIVKWCDPALEFGLNVWNRNHFNSLRRAQWPWAEQAEYADWVKPIAYQHQAGAILANEAAKLALLGLDALLPFWPGVDPQAVIGTGLDATDYTRAVCKDAVEGLAGRIPVFMGIGVDAPRPRPEVARCTPSMVRDSVLAAYDAGAEGVVFAPSYALMNLATLDGGAAALRELGRMA